VRVRGGGSSGQAGALRHGIARALIEADPELRVFTQARRLSDPRCSHRRAKKGRLAQGSQGAAVLEALIPARRSSRMVRLLQGCSALEATLSQRGEKGGSRFRWQLKPQVEIASARRYFGTDGVRGVVGEDLTVELVEQLAGPRHLVEQRPCLRRSRHAGIRR